MKKQKSSKKQKNTLIISCPCLENGKLELQGIGSFKLEVTDSPFSLEYKIIKGKTYLITIEEV